MLGIWLLSGPNLGKQESINPRKGIEKVVEHHHLMKGRKKIGIKYCGRCNPTYERVEMVQRVKYKLKDQFLFLQHDQQNLDVLVLINGCIRACADKILNQIKDPHRSIIRESDFESLIDWLASFNDKGEKK